MNNESGSALHLDRCAQVRIAKSLKTLLKLGEQISSFNTKAQTFLGRTEVKDARDRCAKKPKKHGRNQSESRDDGGEWLRRAYEYDHYYGWNLLVREAQYTMRRIRKCIATLKTLGCELEEAGIDIGSREFQEGFDAFRASEAEQAVLFSKLIELGFNGDFLRTAMKKAREDDKLPDIETLVRDLTAMRDDFSAAVNKRMMIARGAEQQHAAITSDVETGSSASSGVGTSVSGLAVLPFVAGAAVGVAGFSILGWFFYGVGRALVELFNDTDDDNAVDFITRRGCKDLNALSLDVVLTLLLRPMLSGPTTDRDERAILRLLECAPCDRVWQIVNAVGMYNLLNDFDGVEWDLLVNRLQACGMLSFTTWDDDATRLFITFADCATINSLTNLEIRDLLLNMFEGDTGEDDEDMILRLMRCLPCTRMRQLVGMRDLSFDDFDDEVGGEQWDRLERILNNCGLRED